MKCKLVNAKHCVAVFAYFLIKLLKRK